MKGTQLTLDAGTVVQEYAQQSCFSRDVFADKIISMTDEAFNFFCREVLNAYEFMISNQGECVTQDASLAGLYAGRQIDMADRHYDLEYIIENLYPILSPVSIIAQSIHDNDYDRQTFLYFLNGLTDRQFMAFALEVECLVYYRVLHEGRYIISNDVMQSNPAGCYRMDYGPYRDSIENKVVERFP